MRNDGVTVESMRAGRCVAPVAASGLSTFAQPSTPQALASWNEGPTKDAIVKFVTDATTRGTVSFVAPGERIAVFDNDGTLWPEQPVPVQFVFALDRVKAVAPEHPEWKEREPFKSILAGDMKTALAGGEGAAAALLAATHSGMATDEFEAQVRAWIATARHPRFGRPYTELVYRPMLELLGYLRDQGFKTFIVSGGGAEFLRPWTEQVYGVPPEQVIGSQGKVAFELRDGMPVLVKLPQIDLVDDKAGKPVGIHKQIGRRPIAACGNSDGDLQMLQWTTAGPGPRFALLVRHTDAEREWAYERTALVGELDKALVEAKAKGWTVVDMKRDWKKVYAFE
jgi:hypothetical protein